MKRYHKVYRECCSTGSQDDHPRGDQATIGEARVNEVTWKEADHLLAIVSYGFFVLPRSLYAAGYIIKDP